MKRGVTKEEIIHATQELIARNGIRAVRVDEIAQTLGISKRTLYEMFTDKNDLVSACLDAMSTSSGNASSPAANGAAAIRCKRCSG